MTFDRKAFALAIHDKRCDLQKAAERNLGLREIGKMMDLSAPTLSRILKCERSDINTILAVCKWLNKDVTEFIIKT